MDRRQFLSLAAAAGVLELADAGALLPTCPRPSPSTTPTKPVSLLLEEMVGS
jgi:hypothetical protein